MEIKKEPLSPEPVERAESPEDGANNNQEVRVKEEPMLKKLRTQNLQDLDFIRYERIRTEFVYGPAPADGVEVLGVLQTRPIPISSTSVQTESPPKEPPPPPPAPAPALGSRPSEDSLSCSYCSYKGSTLHSLNRHLRDKHSKDSASRDRRRCRWCSYFTNSSSSLTKHIANVHQISAPPPNTPSHFTCSTCSFSTHLRLHLYQHIESHHYTTWYQCLFCSFQTKIRSDMDHHCRSHH